MSNVLPDSTNSKNHRRPQKVGGSDVSKGSAVDSCEKKSIGIEHSSPHPIISESGLTVADIQQRSVSFLPEPELHQYFDDPFAASRWEYTSEQWYTASDIEDSINERLDFLCGIKQSETHKNTLLCLWNRESQDLSLDSPVTKHLLRELVHHQLGDRVQPHCVGMETPCVKAILYEQTSKGGIPHFGEYSERAHAFALAVGTALATVVQIQDDLPSIVYDASNDGESGDDDSGDGTLSGASDDEHQ